MTDVGSVGDPGSCCQTIVCVIKTSLYLIPVALTAIGILGLMGYLSFAPTTSISLLAAGVALTLVMGLACCCCPRLFSCC